MKETLSQIFNIMDNCIFCKEFKKDKIIYQDHIWIAISDSYPVSSGHTLLIPKRHCNTFFDLSYIELKTMYNAIKNIKDILDKRYNPDGYNIGMNCGEAAGQSIMHCHIHIIPRYDGDTDNPRGGVRGVIPEKQKY